MSVEPLSGIPSKPVEDQTTGVPSKSVVYQTQATSTENPLSQVTGKIHQHVSTASQGIKLKESERVLELQKDPKLKEKYFREVLKNKGERRQRETDYGIVARRVAITKDEDKRFKEQEGENVGEGIDEGGGQWRPKRTPCPVILFRGCNEEQLKALIRVESAGGKVKNKEVGRPSDDEARSQAGGEGQAVIQAGGKALSLLSHLPEFTTDIRFAESFGRKIDQTKGGFVVTIEIDARYLNRGSDAEKGWVAYDEAPLKVISWKEGADSVMLSSSEPKAVQSHSQPQEQGFSSLTTSDVALRTLQPSKTQQDMEKPKPEKPQLRLRPSEKQKIQEKVSDGT